MTDNEIIKALELCKGTGCIGCPLHLTADCVRILQENAIDLINRQKAEIERLKQEKKRMLETANILGDALDECKKENEKWQRHNVFDKPFIIY